MAKKKYYLVIFGRMPGLYDTWKACRDQVYEFSGAEYKGFASLEEASRYADKEMINYGGYIIDINDQEISFWNRESFLQYLKVKAKYL